MKFPHRYEYVDTNVRKVALNSSFMRLGGIPIHARSILSLKSDSAYQYTRVYARMLNARRMLQELHTLRSGCAEVEPRLTSIFAVAFHRPAEHAH